MKTGGRSLRYEEIQSLLMGYKNIWTFPRGQLEEVEHLSVVICHLVSSCAPVLTCFVFFYFLPLVSLSGVMQKSFSPGLRKRKQLR